MPAPHHDAVHRKLQYNDECALCDAQRALLAYANNQLCCVDDAHAMRIIRFIRVAYRINEPLYARQLGEMPQTSERFINGHHVERVGHAYHVDGNPLDYDAALDKICTRP